MYNKDYTDTIRRLAKNDYYQSLYNVSKELGFTLFENITQLTKIQLILLNYISVYATINMDIVMGDVNERVLENDVYTDAYMVYKSQSSRKRTEEVAKAKSNYRNQPTDIETDTVKKSSWLFKR